MGRAINKTIPQVSENTLKIQAYLENQKPGARVSYAAIGHATGVVMDDRGKSYLRSALHRAKLEYGCIQKYGIELADPKNAMSIVGHKLQKIDRSVRRGERTHKNIQEQFFSSLPVDKQREILYIGAVFGAIRVAADNGKVIYIQKQKDVASSINIPIPKM